MSDGRNPCLLRKRSGGQSRRSGQLSISVITSETVAKRSLSGKRTPLEISVIRTLLVQLRIPLNPEQLARLQGLGDPRQLDVFGHLESLVCHVAHAVEDRIDRVTLERGIVGVSSPQRLHRALTVHTHSGYAKCSTGTNVPPHLPPMWHSCTTSSRVAETAFQHSFGFILCFQHNEKDLHGASHLHREKKKKRAQKCTLAFTC